MSRGKSALLRLFVFWGGFGVVLVVRLDEMI